MAKRSVRHRHALHHTETINPHSEHRFEKGFSWCDPKGIKPIPGECWNDWRPSSGVYVSAEQDWDDLMKATCPECAKRWGKNQVDALGNRITIEKIDNYCSYVKSTYRVTLDGLLRGYVVIANGWGEKWRIHRVANDARSYATFSRSEEPVGATIESYSIHPIHRSSMNGLASLFPKLVEEGKLRTAAEQQEIDRLDKEQRAERERQRVIESEERTRQRAIEEQERQERRTLAREAVKAVSDRAAALGLSNSETIGLVEALKIIG